MGGSGHVPVCLQDLDGRCGLSCWFIRSADGLALHEHAMNPELQSWITPICVLMAPCWWDPTHAEGGQEGRDIGRL